MPTSNFCVLKLKTIYYFSRFSESEIWAGLGQVESVVLGVTLLDAFICCLGWAGAPRRFCSHAQASVSLMQASLSILSPPLTPGLSMRSLSSRIAGFPHSLMPGFQEWKRKLPGLLKARHRTGRVLLLALSIGQGKSHSSDSRGGKTDSPSDGWCDLHVQWEKK